jgi:hypothetical protein
LDTKPRDHTYQAESQLLVNIINLVFRLKRDCYFCDLILLLYSGYMYNRYQTDIQFFAYCEAAMIGTLGLVQYLMLSAKSEFVNRTVIDIRFGPKHIHIKTATFDGPLWFKKKSADLSLPLAGLLIKTVDNPYPQVFKENKQLLRLRYQDKDVYLLANYFDRQVEEELIG